MLTCWNRKIFIYEIESSMYQIKLRKEEQNDLYPILFSVSNHQQDPNY